MDRLLLADGYGIKPGSSNYRDLIKSANQYGLIKGNEKSDHIALTELGTSYTKPINAGEREATIFQVVQRPELASKVYQHFNRSKWPDQKFLKNLLERQFGVSADWSTWTAETLNKNARFAGAIRTISGSSMLMLAPPAGAPLAEAASETPQDPENGSDSIDAPPEARVTLKAGNGTSTAPPTPPKTAKSAIFVGHGKNTGPLTQLKAILDQFKIPYRIAVYEANRGLPISAKVRQLMDECSSAILIFTKDECLYDKEAKEIWRPSENVVHELGAAGALYGGRIIVFKENGLELPTNFRDIGYISFAEGDLRAKAVELLQELIAFGLVAIKPAES